MAWLDWLLNLWVLLPLAGLIPALNEFGRLILVEKKNLVPAMAGVILIGDSMAALGYAFLSRWRPTLVSLLLFVAFLAGMRWVGPRFARGTAARPSLVRNLVESGRRVKEDLRATVINWGLFVAVFALGVSGIHLAFGAFLVAVFAAWSLIWFSPIFRTTQTGVAIAINCPPEAAVDFVSAVVNQPRYVPEIEHVEPLSPGQPQLGSTFLVRTALGQEGVEEILEYDRPRRFASGLAGRVGRNRSIWTFESTDSGTRARYDWRIRLTIVEALIGMRVAVHMSRQQRNAQRRLWLERLKTVLEGQEQEPAA